MYLLTLTWIVAIHTIALCISYTLCRRLLGIRQSDEAKGHMDLVSKILLLMDKTVLLVNRNLEGMEKNADLMRKNVALLNKVLDRMEKVRDRSTEFHDGVRDFQDVLDWRGGEVDEAPEGRGNTTMETMEIVE